MVPNWDMFPHAVVCSITLYYRLSFCVYFWNFIWFWLKNGNVIAYCTTELFVDDYKFLSWQAIRLSHKYPIPDIGVTQQSKYCQRRSFSQCRSFSCIWKLQNFFRVLEAVLKRAEKSPFNSPFHLLLNSNNLKQGGQAMIPKVAQYFSGDLSLQALPTLIPLNHI